VVVQRKGQVVVDQVFAGHLAAAGARQRRCACRVR